MSAHRDPDTVAEYCRNARMRGLRVIIAGAGLSAALPGRRRRAHRPAGHRRAAVEPPQRARRPRRGAVDRPDAAGRPGRRASGSTTPATPATWPRASWAPERRVAVERPPRLDLTRPRAYGELLSTSLQIFAAHVDVLLTLAIVLVAPVTLFVDGVWGGLLADGLDAKPSLASQITSALLSACIVLPLVTGASALLVQGLGRGDAPRDAGGALRAATRVFPRVLGAQLLYAVAVLAGLVLLIVPGIYARRPLLLRHPGRRAGRPGAGGGDAPQRRGRAGLVVAHARLPADDRAAGRGHGRDRRDDPRRHRQRRALRRRPDRVPGDRGGRQRACSRRSSTTTCGRGTSGGRSPATETMAP